MPTDMGSAVSQAPCTLELSRSQPCLGASGMLLTPPSSPVAGHLTSYKPDWEASFKVCPPASIVEAFRLP